MTRNTVGPGDVGKRVSFQFELPNGYLGEAVGTLEAYDRAAETYLVRDRRDQLVRVPARGVSSSLIPIAQSGVILAGVSEAIAYQYGARTSTPELVPRTFTKPSYWPDLRPEALKLTVTSADLPGSSVTVPTPRAGAGPLSRGATVSE